MICCQIIQANQWIWTCTKCYHMFHINRSNSSGCITQWAVKSRDTDGEWRCPSCQNISLEIPKEYKCFCGKRNNPPTRRFPETPHSCGGTCGRSRGHGCPHPCTEECHPGPCCPCPATVTCSCDCGTEIRTLRCGTPKQFKCDKVCGKLLNCRSHKCEIVCHAGPCMDCKEKVRQICFCGLASREVPCSAEDSSSVHYSCGAPCDGKYNCGVHKCTSRCHEKKKDGTCGPCPLSPDLKHYCPCGCSRIPEGIRRACSDPVPTCGNTCNKVLPCGPKDKPHRCKQLCHEGPCAPCLDNTVVTCRCKALKKTLPCCYFLIFISQSFLESNPLLCEKRCKKLKSCQNHRCQAVCCVETEHVCLQENLFTVCNKKLDCGNHFCDRLCHIGQCPKCLQASLFFVFYHSFLLCMKYCLCGKTVREPPIPCGTPLPTCDAPCSRTHSCSHPPLHTCHAEPECPPCTVLTAKECYGRHEMRANIPCYLNEVSCGKPCNAPLPCGVHFCKRTCHPPPCVPAEDYVCKQPCPIKRTDGDCEHPCGLPCHGSSVCPKSECLTKVTVTCNCMLRKAEMKMAMKMDDLAEEKSFLGGRQILKCSDSSDNLHCDAECRRIGRNKAVAEALNIKTDHGVSGVASSMYTDFLKSYLKANFKHVQAVEDILIGLVHELENTCETHSFPPMNSELRRVIHEYASYFKIETRSYDSEPMRNVVATAKRSG
ncbi:unnamed protein product [Enterobius vermicularis]|uniref:R3H domain-containing protein n=1 Tax=Enterobius vermicularis TaxID=51028 RepID=A0A0N4UW62_ENTVE|nr:unnamed protein product [Enterobius vermicularis]